MLSCKADSDGKNDSCFVSLRANDLRDGTVIIVAGYRLDCQGIRVWVLVGEKTFSLHVIQTGCRAHSASHLMSNVSSFLSSKVAEE
jgi:hypothetical protein